MKIVETRYYFGPNRFVSRSAISHRLDLRDLRAGSSSAIDGECIARVCEYFPELRSLDTNWMGAPGSKLTRRIACLFGTIIWALQKRANHKVRFAKVFRAARPKTYDIVHDFEIRDVGAGAALLALATLIDILPDALLPDGIRDPSFQFKGGLEAFLDFAAAHPIRRPLLKLARAAHRRGIFVQELSRVGAIQLGQGVRRKRIGSAMLVDTPEIYQDFLKNRSDLYTFLHEYGIPVPRSRIANSLEETRRFAEYVGYPVEIVCGEELDPAQSILRLDSEVALDAAIEKGRISGRVVIVADRDTMQRHEFSIDDTIEIVQDGIARPPDNIHPDYLALARRALEAIGLDRGSVVIGTPDLKHSPVKAKATVRTMRPARFVPLGSAQLPRSRSPDEILDELFPTVSSSQIPVCCITGSNGKTTTTYLTNHIVRTAGLTTGLATTYGAEIEGRLIEKGDLAGAHTALIVLQSPRVEAAILETAYGGIAKFGLGPGDCSVGAVINVTTDHVGKGGVKSIEDLAEYKSIVVKYARDAVVLNADDPPSLAMRSMTKAKTICLVSRQPDNAAIALHEENEGSTSRLVKHGDVAFLELFTGKERIKLCRVDQVPITFGGRAEHNVENALFAAAIAYYLGTDVGSIIKGLQTFESSFENLPGRVNFFAGLPFQVMLDYAHNPEGMDTITRFTDRLDVSGRRTCVLTSPGNRPDKQLVLLGRTAAPHFDQFFLCPEEDLRGRNRDEVPTFLRQGLAEAGVPDERIISEPSEEAAMEHAFASSRERDLVAVFVANLDRARDQIEDEVGKHKGDKQ